jgi:predicted kinase
MTYKPELVLIRGLPGSGKSTMARAMTGFVHLEADMHMMINGVYQYDASKVADSHSQCKAQVREALGTDHNVVVSNTFSRAFEMADYLAIAKGLGVSVRVVEATGRWPNVHGVPQDRIEQMRRRWEKVALSYP